MIAKKFYVGEIIEFKGRKFKIISVSPVFENENIRENDIRKLIYHGGMEKLINYFVVAKNKKLYLSFIQDNVSNAKLTTENKMYAGNHHDIPKRKIKSYNLL